MKRATVVLMTILACVARRVDGQADTRMTISQGTVRYGKWLTAGAAIALTAMAAHEHSRSTRDWDELLALCRSGQDVCVVGPDGHYLTYQAELLYQRSLYYDGRANRRLLGAQASLLLTAALFIIDLSGRSDGPENIPFSPLRVTASPREGRVNLGVRLAF